MLVMSAEVEPAHCLSFAPRCLLSCICRISYGISVLVGVIACMAQGCVSVLCMWRQPPPQYQLQGRSPHTCTHSLLAFLVACCDCTYLCGYWRYILSTNTHIVAL